ncbi:MAG: DNA helicase II [Gammaproteobacteria bacterium]|nr:DNA helicase II [Gammaproteobacteria bacterium]
MQTQSNFLNQLNPEQQKAVMVDHANLLVLAGAGSGKTRVLVHRIAFLVQTQHLSPYAILAVTFTNKAANEMRGRVESMIEFPIQNMWIGTFHHIAHRLLRQHWKAAHLPESFQILDSEDQYRLIRRIIRDLNLDEEKYPAKQLQWYINKQKDEGLRAHQIGNVQNSFEQNVIKIYQEYEKTCQQNGLVDFAELLLRSYELLKNNSEILHHYQARFQYILVDEFQDTNKIQYAFLHLLVTQHNHIMVVGDDDQSIYSWRGAKSENIQNFLEDFPNTQIIKLEQNYRSTGNILKAANRLIAHNNERLGKDLWTEGAEGEPISFYEAFNDFDEARFVTSQIQHFRQMGNPYRECSILYRSNAQSRIFEQVLIDNNIPYRIYGGLRFFERAEIKNALAYLHLVANQHNDAAFERVINTPTRGIGYLTLEKIRNSAREQAISLWTATQQMIQKKSATTRTVNALLEFINLIEQLSLCAKTVPLHQLTERTIYDTKLVDYHKKEGGEKARARLENLEELISATKQFVHQGGSSFATQDVDTVHILSEFLSAAALESGEGQADPHSDYVQLMTLHAAKGLEFPVVFLTGLEENIFPHKMSLEETHGLEEERRLCYVGMTRAKQKLFLTCAQMRRLHGYDSMQYPSRFIHEIPAEYVEPVRMKMRVREYQNRTNRTSFARGANPRTKSEMRRSVLPREHSPFNLGEIVSHPKFGEGVVISLEGEGETMRILIHFKRVGQKWLALKYAKLEKITS